MSRYTLTTVDELWKHPEAYADATVAGAELVRARLHDYPPADFDLPAVIVLDEWGQPVAGLAYKASVDCDGTALTVRFAWSQPGHPMALMKALAALRRAAKRAGVVRLRFGFSPRNASMADAARKLRGRIILVTVEFDL